MHGKPPRLTGNEHPNLVPYAIFPTRTDNIFIGVGNDGTFRKLCKEIGKPELGSDPRFARNKDRIANRDALRAEPPCSASTTPGHCAIACSPQACRPVRCSRSTRR
jgi:crotonobetainyl-CoA:carnitine CoA-transferase CaiB-like acyl-CoA transferase